MLQKLKTSTKFIFTNIKKHNLLVTKQLNFTQQSYLHAWLYCVCFIRPHIMYN